MISKPPKRDSKEAPYPELVAGGPPYPPYANDDQKYGLSILDWFAGRIAAGLCANTSVVKAVGPSPQPTDGLVGNELALSIAETAYTVAAYMVDVREQVPIEPTPVPSLAEEEQVFEMVDPKTGDKTIITGWDAKKVRDMVKLGGAPKTQETGPA